MGISQSFLQERRYRITAVLLFIFLFVLAINTASAASTAINFDSYSLGNINGQDGWSKTGPYDVAVVANTYGYSTFGTQSLRISNAITSGSFGDQTFSKALVDEAGETSATNDGYSGGIRQPYFEASWDFASTVPGAEQVGLQVVASPDRGDGARMSWLRMADAPGGLTVSFYDFDHQPTVDCGIPGASWRLTDIATGLSRTVPHRIKITMQFVDGIDNDVVQVFVDGALVYTGHSWEDYFRDCEPPLGQTHTVDSILFRMNGTAVPANSGNGFLIDNMTTYSGPFSQTAVEVSPANMNGWGFLQETAVASGSIVSGPATPPAGTGSAQLTVDNTGGELIGAGSFGGTYLRDINALTYYAYRQSGAANLAPALQLNIDYDLTDATTSWQGRLVYEPLYSGTNPATGVWEMWNALSSNARWWASGAPGSTVCPHASPCTWGKILTSFPNAGIHATLPGIGFKAGGGWTGGFVGNVDDFTIGVSGTNTVYDFEPSFPVHNITQSTDHPTIQDGINNAASGDVIEIDPGTYAENVVIDIPLTLRGAGAGTNPALHTILNGAALGTSTSGIHLLSGVTHVTIEDLTVQNYILPNANYAGISGAGSNNNLVVQRVSVLNNTGGRGGLYLNGPVDTVLIDAVTAHDNQGRGIVIWNGLKTHITITNNDVRRNNCCGIELQDGTASGVTITGNTVQGNTDSGMAAIGLTSGAGPNVIANNTMTDNGRFGIEIKLANGTGLTSGDGSIVVENNTISRTTVPADARDLAGIAVFRRGWLAGNADIPTGVIVRSNTVSGYQQTSTSDGFGIVVEGTNMQVLNNTLTSNDVGVQVQSGHLPYTANTSIDGNQNNLVDTYFGRGNSPIACVTVSGSIYTSNTVNYRTVGAEANDNPTVFNQTANTYHCSIQSAIDAAAANDTIVVPAGTYVEELNIDKSLTLNGPNIGVDANTGTRIPEAIVIPETPGTDPNGTCTIMAYIDANNVTIDGFTFDGNNPFLTSGVLVNGVDVDACEGIAAYGGVGTTTIENNIVTNVTYTGMDFYNDGNGGAATSNNYIRYNQIANVGNSTIGYGIGTLLYNNFYADVSQNVYNDVRVGIQTGNYNQPNPGTTGRIHQNEINAWRSGIFHNLWYSNAAVISVDNNTINAIDSTGTPGWNGMLLASWQNSANTLILNNTINIGDITQLASGYNVWNTPTTAPLTISGGSVNGGDYSVFVNNYDGYASSAGDTAIIVDGVTLANAAIAGVYAKDNTLNTNSAIVSATIQNSTINNSVTAFQVEGSDAAMTAKGNTVNTNPTAFAVTNGSLLAYANNITNFNTGVNNSGGTLNANHNWWGAIMPAGVNDTNAYDYRLGAAVSTWGEGTLGSASLISAGGSGTGVIVSHGRGLANVPFGKGNNPYASATCSDYYDFFVLNANGDWTVNVPIDTGAACDDALANHALYQFALSGTMPDTACVGGTCWEPPTGVGDVSRSLQVTLDAPTYLLGTPFVAGDNTPDSNDPTAVSLSTFSASTNRMGGITAVLLAFLILTTFILWKRRTN